MSDNFQNTCICPDPWCPMHAVDVDGHRLMILDTDDLAFCPVCEMDRLPVGVCKTNQ